MPDKKTPVIVVKTSRLKAPAAEPPLPEPHADTGAVEAETLCVLPTPAVPDTAREKTAPPTRKQLNKKARKSRDKIAHFARTFPALWPDFEEGKLRPMKVGIKEQVKAYIEANPDCGMTFSQWIQAVILVVRRIQYQRCVREGEIRYGIHGEPAGVVTAREAAYARLQVTRIKARLDARAKQNHVTAE